MAAMPAIVVYHSHYGCDTGCCGHRIELQDADENVLEGWWTFDHPERNADLLEYAKRLVTEHAGAEHVKDLDWDRCRISDD